GDRAAQAGRAGGRGRGFPEDRASRPAEGRRRDRYLRRPPHGDELLARRARRRAGGDQRSRLRRQDLPAVLRALEEDPVVTVPVIAIDGPSASGKGTIAKRVAAGLGFHYLESGALYRLVALLALRKGIEDEPLLAGEAEHMDVLFSGDEILLEDQDVSLHVRHEEVGNRASEVARMPAVR